MVYANDKQARKHCIERGGLLDNFAAVRFQEGFAQTTLWISNSLSTPFLADMRRVMPDLAADSFVGFQNFFKSLAKIQNLIVRRFCGFEPGCAARVHLLPLTCLLNKGGIQV